MEPLIAIVDDDLRTVFALSAFVEGWGYRVVGFSGGESFIDQYKPEPGCVLLDMVMPDVDGAEVLRRVAGLGWTVPVIAYCIDPRSEILARQLGAVGFLLKPIQTELLTDLLGQFALIPDEPHIRSSGG